MKISEVPPIHHPNVSKDCHDNPRNLFYTSR
nr:MAG TPA: hypothetical protein [Caudoviricetes sp.]